MEKLENGHHDTFDTWIRTHDGGLKWEAACGCGYRSDAYAQRTAAESAGRRHVESRQ